MELYLIRVSSSDSTVENKLPTKTKTLNRQGRYPASMKGNVCYTLLVMSAA